MPPVNRRPAPARTAAPATRRTPVAAGVSSGYRGEEGRRRMQEEQERAEARREANASMSGAPFRFFCPVGETREVIVVDDAPDFFRHEHNMKDSHGKWSVFTSCIADHANCPVCMGNPDKQPYFAMYLTIIDLTPYTNRDGVEVPWSKKLMVVKSNQQKKIMRLYERHGTLRGMILSMTRDGEKDAAIGNDIEFVEFIDEDTLATYVNSYVNKDNKPIEVIGSEPFDYEELFPPQTEEMLAALVGGTVNNYDSHSRNIGRGSSRGGSSSGDGWQDRAPARTARAAAPARGAPRRGAQEPEDEAEDDAPPARPAARPAPRTAAPPPRAAATRAAPARRGAPEPEEEAEDEAPPARPAHGAPSRRAEPEPEYEDPPQRVARAAPRAAPEPSLAQRRQQLRGR